MKSKAVCVQITGRAEDKSWFVAVQGRYQTVALPLLWKKQGSRKRQNFLVPSKVWPSSQLPS